MSPILQIRQNQPALSKELPRDVVAYISAGSAVLLVLGGVLIGWIVRKCRRGRRIRERRKTQLAQRKHIHLADPKKDFQRSYSLKTTTSAGSFSPQDDKRQAQDERWKWNPPTEPGFRPAVQIPPNAKFF